MYKIPVIDLFAGPGGLSHGFSSFSDVDVSFKIALSIEKDEIAYKTLHLRAFLRQFKKVPENYYRYIRGESNLSRTDLAAAYPEEWSKAEQEAKQWELGKQPFHEVYKAINSALNLKEAPVVSNSPFWLLIGGPPCQAYSLAGRSRMKNEKSFAGDHRHTLYREYLKIVAAHQPAVFVMENVKGILSSTYGSRGKGGSIFGQILEDLRHPARAVGDEQDVKRFLPKHEKQYRIYSFVTKATKPEGLEPADFVIRSEDWGVPQKRHRVILLGVRDDVPVDPFTLGEFFDRENTNVEALLAGMPRLRSRISRGNDSSEAWAGAIKKISERLLINSIRDEKIRIAVEEYSAKLKPTLNTGGKFTIGEFRPAKLANWIWDKRLGGIIQHESRSHMQSDLRRYFFAACGAATRKYSLKLRDYPKSLLPNHKNAQATGTNSEKIDFEDRFRVQVRGEPATTITSHISKDGHYYIHYDPLQCRSLTVREAARLQTFPESYYFEGNRTEQYHQVGNAVPSLLAVKLAKVVADLICRGITAKSELSPSKQKEAAVIA